LPIYKRCSRCNKRILEGTKCECIKARHKEYKRYRTDDKEQAFYSSNDFQIIKEKVKTRLNGLDIYSYYVNGAIEYGQTVHHVETIKDNWSRRLDMDNLIYLTESNHQMIHKLYDKDITSKIDTMMLLNNLIERFLKEFNQ